MNSGLEEVPALLDPTSILNSLQREAARLLEFMSTQILHTKEPAAITPLVAHR